MAAAPCAARATRDRAPRRFGRTGPGAAGVGGAACFGQGSAGAPAATAAAAARGDCTPLRPPTVVCMRAFCLGNVAHDRQKLGYEYEREELQVQADALHVEEQEARKALGDLKARMEALQRQIDTAEVPCRVKKKKKHTLSYTSTGSSACEAAGAGCRCCSTRGQGGSAGRQGGWAAAAGGGPEAARGSGVLVF